MLEHQVDLHCAVNLSFGMPVSCANLARWLARPLKMLDELAWFSPLGQPVHTTCHVPYENNIHARTCFPSLHSWQEGEEVKLVRSLQQSELLLSLSGTSCNISVCVRSLQGAKAKATEEAAQPFSSRSYRVEAVRARSRLPGVTGKRREWTAVLLWTRRFDPITSACLAHRHIAAAHVAARIMCPSERSGLPR